MAFAHAQASIVQLESIQPHHDHSQNASGPTVNDELDVEIAALIAKFALDDLADVMGSRKGKARDDSLPSDDEIAYLLQCEQYDQWASIEADAKLAKSIDSALAADAAYLDAFIIAEEAAVEDRITAELLSRGEALPVPKSCQTRLEDPNFIMNPELVPEMDVTQLYQAGPDALNSDVLKNDDKDGDHIESESDQIYVPFPTARSKHSNPVGKRSIAGPSVNRNKLVRCVSCHEYCRYFETLKTPCDHYYCSNCLVTFVEAFTRDESLFPLRCCQDPIPVAEVLPTLSLELRSLFQRKNAEFSVLSGDRLYCSNPNCCTFLGSSEGRLSVSAIECPHCLANTCLRCKEPAHPGEGCGVSALQALAKCRGWQTCPGCNTVVELNDGCNHITCRCSAQFFYLCAARWKTCNCAQR